MSPSVIPGVVLEAMIQAARRAPAGDIVEVGVYRGGSAFELASVAFDKGVKLHLFDTFCGMPFADPEDKHQPGEFSDTSLVAVQRLIPDAICYPGIFPATLPDALNPIAFVHCDVDQHRSTRDVILSLWWRLVPGGIMWFDDCELAPALNAIAEHVRPEYLREGPKGRLYGVKP